ncbi:MAG: hypothetical protein NTX52_11835 [Planctomycetota bacterium]|nr:hypothetical protein [Planctomycetota bacterium]
MQEKYHPDSAGLHPDQKPAPKFSKRLFYRIFGENGKFLLTLTSCPFYSYGKTIPEKLFLSKIVKKLLHSLDAYCTIKSNIVAKMD